MKELLIIITALYTIIIILYIIQLIGVFTALWLEDMDDKPEYRTIFKSKKDFWLHFIPLYHIYLAIKYLNEQYRRL